MHARKRPYMCRYDSLLDVNMSAPQRLMRFAKRCERLKLFVHISTAYVNGKSEGIVYEKPLFMGQSGIDVADEMILATKSFSASTDSDETKYLKRLGQERAASYGWYNSYHLTKAMGEMVLNEIRGDVSLLVVRPSVIESSYKEPFPGWIQGKRMSDPVIISYGRGLLPAFLADPNVHLDIVPVDMVTNTTIAAIAKHGSMNKPNLSVYHVATDFVNPLRVSDFVQHIHEHFSMNPLKIGLKTMEELKLFQEFSDFSKYTRDVMQSQSGMRSEVRVNGGIISKFRQKEYRAKVAYAEQLCKMYEFIGFFKARFHTGNTQKLMEEMSKEEQMNFEVDATKID